MAKRTGPVSTAFAVVVALPFVALGAHFAWSALRSGQLVGAGFGALFAGVGAWQIVRAIRDRRTPEALAGGAAAPQLAPSAPAGLAGYRESAPRARSAAEVYAPVLASAPLPKVRAELGRSLAVALGVEPVSGVVFTFAFCALWLGGTVPAMVVALRAGSFGGAAFMLLFVAVGVGILWAGASKLLARTKLPRVEVDAEPAYLGDDLVVRVEQRGPASVRRLQVDVECRETARYTVGTDTRTDTSDVWAASIYDEAPGEIVRGDGVVVEGRVTLPAGLPHSFKAPNNAIEWSVRVRADIANWPDYDERFELCVVPKVPS